MIITAAKDNTVPIFIGARSKDSYKEMDLRNTIRLGPGESWDTEPDIFKGQEMLVMSAKEMPAKGTELQWKTIENTDNVFTERARIDAAHGWLVRTWQDNKIVAQTFVPDDNDMWR